MLSENRTTVSLQGLSDGIYVVRVLTDEKYLSQKILKR
ncbi:MAG: T9SS type A sorting domain-containing protein, partial [Flavobacteriales bacterium]|nr:T9SS type A sorting domain-containing protein [Flavobacteriales bacterium]